MSFLETNAIAFVISSGLLAGYHLYLRYRLRKNPAYTIQAINAHAREIWVSNIMADPDRDILAVQTLRNSTMAGTFLASTAILLIIGVLNLMQNSGGLSPMAGLLQPEHSILSTEFWKLTLLPLLIVFFWAFFCFSLAVRLYNHVGYLINASDSKSFGPTPAYVARLLNRSGNYYSLGMRAYYLSVPLVFWLFGPGYLVAASIGLVIVLNHVDRAPDELGSPQRGKHKAADNSSDSMAIQLVDTGTD